MDGEAIIMSINEELKINDPCSFIESVKARIRPLYVFSFILITVLLFYFYNLQGKKYNGIISYFGEFALIIVVVSILVILGIMGMKGKRRHYEKIMCIPLRIHINGIRGKSTVTRLIGAGLREGGYRTLTKTTGKAACLVLWDGDEIPVKRMGRPNIREQMRIVDFARRNDVDALVIECMAIQPELQRVCEEKIIRSKIGVITNIRRDHIDVMGPTLIEVAKNICSTIPENGIIVTAERDFLEEIKVEARKRNAEVIIAEPEKISDDVMNKFTYLNFKENVAMALAVCRLAGVDEETALMGMQKAEPDPGHVMIYCCNIPLSRDKRVYFVNAMGVNDKDSTTIVYDELIRRGYFNGRGVIGFFHARDDRVTRTKEFGKAMVEDMEFKRIVIAGGSTKLFRREAVRVGYAPEHIIDMGTADGGEVMDLLHKIADLMEGEVVIFACGNMVGKIPEKMLSIAKGICSEEKCL